MKKAPFSFLWLSALLLMGAGCLFTSQKSDSEIPAEEAAILAGYERDLDGITVEINSPETVTIDDTFTFGVDIHNTQDRSRSLRSIDIKRSFLEGLDITDINLERSYEYYVESIDEDIFEFNTPLEPNESLTIVFTATAKKTGNFSGDFDVCIDNDINCAFETISVVIQ